MKHTDFIVLNMMKHQLLDIYQTYYSTPRLLEKDTTLNEGFQSLVSVTTVDEFSQWRKLISVLGLSFEDCDSPKRRDNMLGWLDDIADKAGNDAIVDFVRWKNGFDSENWFEQWDKQEDALRHVENEVNRDYDVHIVLFRCGDQWAAIGNDADRLFEIFGWQTGSVFDGDSEESFMYVTKYGLMVIEASGYSFKVVDVGKVDILCTSFNEMSVATFQQQVDCIRMANDKAGETKELMRYSLSVAVPKPAYRDLVNARVFIEDDGGVIAKMDSGRIITLVDGTCWRLDRLGMTLLESLSHEMNKD